MFLNRDHLGSTILDFVLFPEPLKSAKIDQKVIKNNKKNTKMIKVVGDVSTKLQFFIKKVTIRYLHVQRLLDIFTCRAQEYCTFPSYNPRLRWP